MNGAFWLMAAYHELEEEPVAAPEPVPDEEPRGIVPDKSVRLTCPKCGKSGRGIVIHIRNCKG